MHGLHVDLEVVEVGLVQLDAPLAIADLASHVMERFDGIGDKKNVCDVRTLSEFFCELLEVVLPEKYAKRAGLRKMVPTRALRQFQIAGPSSHHPPDGQN